MKKIYLLLIAFLVSVSFFGCEKEEKADIYTSIYPVYFIATSIVQDKLTVKQIYPAGRDVHEYDPSSTASLIRMAEADLMFYIGAGLEAFIEKAKTTVFNDANVCLVELSEYVTLCQQTSNGYIVLEEGSHDSTHAHTADTHLWIDPLRMIVFVEVMLSEIIKIYPEHEEEFRLNAQNLIDKLIVLDELFLNSITDQYQKIILVDHDAYLYWEQRYGIERIRIRVDNESCDNIPSDIINKIEKAQEYNIKHVVTTANESVCGLVNTYAKGLEAEIIELHPVSSLTTKELDNNEDYFTIMEANLIKLLTILPKK